MVFKNTIERFLKPFSLGNFLKKINLLSYKHGFGNSGEMFVAVNIQNEQKASACTSFEWGLVNNQYVSIFKLPL